MKFSASSVVLLWFAQSVFAVKHGVIGYGITMYKPVCCYACHDSLSSLYLNCTIFNMEPDNGMSMKVRKRMDMGAAMTGSTSDACYANNRPWLETLAYCIRSGCNKDGVEDLRQEKCFGDMSMSQTGLEAALPSRLPVTELEEDAEWLNETMLVNVDLYHANYQTLQEFEKSEDRHTRYATVLLATVVAACLLGGLHRLKKQMLPKVTFWPRSVTRPFQIYFTLPTLFGGRHLQPLPYRLGYVPSRALSTFIAAYIALNLVFSCVSYHNVWPNTWYSSQKYEMAAYVANRTGVLSFANLALAILFSGRNNVLIAVTGWSQSTFLALHRWAARVAAVQAVVHSIIYTATYFWSPGGGAATYSAEAAQPYYWWGIIATVALCLAIAFAVLPIRARYYEVFLVTHIVLAVLILMACWYHVDIRFSKNWGYEVWLYVAFAFWAADRFSRLARLAWYNRKGLAVAGAETLPGGDFVHITVKPKVAWNFAPGQHVFIYFPGLGRFWENHPFSVASWSDGRSSAVPHGKASTMSAPSLKADKSCTTQTSEIEKGFPSPVADSESSSLSTSTPSRDVQPSVHFLLRINGGMTSSLSRHIVSNTASLTEADLPAPRLTFPIALEGPYGGHLSPSLRYADTILCLAGGIGITNCLSYINQFIVERNSPRGCHTMRETTRMVLAWTAKEPELIAHVVDHMLPKDARGSLEVKLWCTGGSQRGENVFEKESRMNIGGVVEAYVERGKKLVVVACGPGGFADEVRAQVVVQAKRGIEVDLVQEAFAW